MIERDLKYDPLKRSSQIKIHGWLLIWSWAFLIPVGTLIWTHAKKHRQFQPLPYMHFLCSLPGVGLALGGFAYGIHNFSTLSRPGVSSFRMAHAIIGTIATCGMILQVLLLALMRHQRIGEKVTSEWPYWQIFGHHAHRFLGWLWLAFGLVACEMGTHMASVTDPNFADLGLQNENEKFAGGFIAALTATAIATTCMVIMYDVRAQNEAPTADDAPEPYEKAKEQEKELTGNGDEESPPPHEVFEIGTLESMEDVALSQ